MNESRTNTSDNYRYIVVMQGQMKNIKNEMVDMKTDMNKGFDDLKKQIENFRKDIRQDFVHKGDFKVIQSKTDFLWNAVIGISGFVIVTVVGALISLIVIY